LALSMPTLYFDLPGVFTQISPPKFTCVRDQKAYEVYQSELAYVKTLHKIVHTLMKTSQSVLSMADSAQLFCNSDQLLVLHTRILNAVRHRLVDQWSQEALVCSVMKCEQMCLWSWCVGVGVCVCVCKGGCLFVVCLCL
jgi:RhoGEF domain